MSSLADRFALLDGASPDPLVIGALGALLLCVALCVLLIRSQRQLRSQNHLLARELEQRHRAEQASQAERSMPGAHAAR